MAIRNWISISSDNANDPANYDGSGPILSTDDIVIGASGTYIIWRLSANLTFRSLRILGDYGTTVIYTIGIATRPCNIEYLVIDSGATVYCSINLIVTSTGSYSDFYDVRGTWSIHTTVRLVARSVVNAPDLSIYNSDVVLKFEATTNGVINFDNFITTSNEVWVTADGGGVVNFNDCYFTLGAYTAIIYDALSIINPMGSTIEIVAGGYSSYCWYQNKVVGGLTATHRNDRVICSTPMSLGVKPGYSYVPESMNYLIINSLNVSLWNTSMVCHGINNYGLLNRNGYNLSILGDAINVFTEPDQGTD